MDILRVEVLCFVLVERRVESFFLVRIQVWNVSGGCGGGGGGGGGVCLFLWWRGRGGSINDVNGNCKVVDGRYRYRDRTNRL